MTALANNEEPLHPDRDQDARALPELLADANDQNSLRVIRLSDIRRRSAEAAQPVRRFSDLFAAGDESSAPVTPFPALRADERGDPGEKSTDAEAERPASWPPASDALAAERLKRRLTAEYREVSHIARVVGQCAFEVLNGTRSLTQMNRWLDLPAMERLRERVSLSLAGAQSTSRVKRTTTVRRSRLCRISDDVYEATVTVQCNHRIRAAALRLERRRGQWRVNALELG
ncbi:Rv3235 family protein [Zhihengliuella halotolerans]|uniref:Rv3235 family protein n=1 Tax=Zhihengliuella halotolerans TaxID=370736 RepID=UPI000C80EA41|nr:Rv3235 family protein [Zhihengliuella halotolerans]